MTKVVRDIRSETSEARKKKIDLHFVMSNVPDLDDEDKILESKIDEFQNRLGFRREPMVVHRYDSLSLLNQMVFTKDRPKSRLAKEYREVVQEIVRSNLADRDGALDYIRRMSRRGRRRWREDESPQKMEEQLLYIENEHSDDGEVLFNLGMIREETRHLEQAGLLFDRAIKAGYDEVEVYLHRAHVRAACNDADGASEDALRVLQSDRATPFVVGEVLRLVRLTIPWILQSRRQWRRSTPTIGSGLRLNYVNHQKRSSPQCPSCSRSYVTIACLKRNVRRQERHWRWPISGLESLPRL